MQREVDELKGINQEQQHRIQLARDGIKQHFDLADELGDLLEREKSQMQKRTDECAMLQREIRDREGEVNYVREQNSRMEQANAQIMRKVEDLRAELEAK